MTEKRDVIVIGAGPNGLACAARLAQTGFRVIVLEASDELGGMAQTLEFAPGFRASACASFLPQLPARLMRGLKLKRYGLTLAPLKSNTVILREHGVHLALEAEGNPGWHAHPERVAYQQFQAQIKKFANALRPAMERAPPKPTGGDKDDVVALSKMALRLRKMGRTDFAEFLRIVWASIYDIADEHFDDDTLKAAVAFDAILGTGLAPRSPGSLFTYLYRQLFNDGSLAAQPLGGSGALCDALAAAVKDNGSFIRLNCRVARILVESGKVTGVVLDSGDVIRSLSVVSSLDPKTTVMELTGARHFETSLVKRVSAMRTKGNVARLHLALSGRPEFRGLAGDQLRHRLLIAADMDALERSFNPSKYAEVTSELAMEVSIPTILDPALAPEGKHVVSLSIPFVPYHLATGWEPQAREALTGNAIKVLSRYVPALEEKIEASCLMTPADIAARYGNSGGNWHHADMALDQFLFTRPVAGATQYRLPVDGLYLCGAGTHPGGGLHATPGLNAADEIAKEFQ